MSTTVIIICSLPFLFLVYRFRSTHIGYGWVLEFNEKNRPEVVIVSRLLKSPVADASIPNGAVLLEHNGVKLDFKSNAEFQAWVNIKPKPARGIALTCRVKDSKGERLITITPMRVRKRIPVYGYVDPNLEDRFVGDRMINFGVRVCPLTGQIHQTRYLVDM